MTEYPRAVVVAAAVLLVAGQCSPAPARALTPPVIDTGALPDPATPAPPHPTQQRQTCSTPAESRGEAGISTAQSSLDLDTLWRMTRGQGQTVAVIDTGVARHPRLARLKPGGDFVSDGDGTQDCDGHGTMVAGIIAAAPDPADVVEFAGIAPAATILTIRQSSTKFGPANDPSVDGVGDVDSMAMAVRTAADMGATVINISSVACDSGPLEDRALGAALGYAVDDKDVVVVVAAGNVGGASHCPQQLGDAAATWEGATVAVSPAWYDDYVLTVGSIGPDGSPSSFTLPGPWVDVAAGGERIVSLNPAGIGLVDALPAFDRSMPISGTSYAAPVVSGLAALVRSRFPELTARQVMQRIEDTAHRPARGWDPFVGNGAVDPVAAVTADGPVLDTHEESPAAKQVTPAVRPVENGPHATAILGAGICAVVVSAVLSVARRRRNRNDVVGDERGVAAEFGPLGQGRQ